MDTSKPSGEVGCHPVDDEIGGAIDDVQKANTGDSVTEAADCVGITRPTGSRRIEA